MNPLLQLTDIKKSFLAVRALKGVSFDLQAGEVHALLGENGAGKSTLIKVITGAHQPDGGTIQVSGETASKLTPAASHKLGIACIYQQPALFPDLSVAENIALTLEPPKTLRVVRWRDRHEQARKLLQRVGANIDSDTEVRRLSMPEQQLVEIAKALGSGAKILIMDEPTASLTQKEVQLLMAVVKDLRAQGVGIIYITHRLEEIFQIADRVTVLRDGESVGTKQVRATLPALEPDCDCVGVGDQPQRVRKFEDPAADAPTPHTAAVRPQVHGQAAVSDLTESELIKLMVGREVSAIYPPAESQPGESVLLLKNVKCSSSGVNNVSFEVRAGEIFGLAGLVGAGRTELARILFGITPSDGGEILLNGKPIQVSSPREAVEHGIAYVPEDRRRHGVILEMPIASNITMAIHPGFFPGSWLRSGKEDELARNYIRDLQIKAYGPEAPGGSLSGGNQQKVALSRWLATKPKVLILDEPTQGVDVGAKSEIHKIIRRLAAQGLAVIMISSDLPEILGMSDRIGVMRGGTMTGTLDGKTADAHSVMAAALGQTERRAA